MKLWTSMGWTRSKYSRLVKNTHLLRCAHPSSLRRTVKYSSFLMISRALHLNVFEQPVKKILFQQPIDLAVHFFGKKRNN
jgi:hypothetical protein